MLSTTSIWNRTEATSGLVTSPVYNAVIGLVLCWGFAVNYVMLSVIPYEAVASINQWVFLIGYIGCVILGVSIYSKSDNPVVSFAGYNLLVFPIGLLLVKFLHFYPAEVIAQAFVTTGMVTLAIMGLAMLYPRAFLSIGRGLFWGLIIAFVMELGVYFITGTIPPVFDWIFVLIFSGYIGYDWARAQALPHTVDNAVDAAASLYVDIVNLFIRLVRIFGRRR